MKATEFHRALRDALGPAFAAAGFTAAKGGIARWSWNEAGRSIRVTFEPNRGGWSSPWGSDFRIEVDESIDGEDALRFSILEFFDVADLQAFCRLRNAVVDKVVARAPGDAGCDSASLARKELKALEKDDVPLPHTDTLFPWLDADDLVQWAGFLAPLAASLVRHLDALAALEPGVRRRALHDRWKQSDPRSDADRAAHRGLKADALARYDAAHANTVAPPPPTPEDEDEP